VTRANFEAFVPTLPGFAQNRRVWFGRRIHAACAWSSEDNRASFPDVRLTPCTPPRGEELEPTMGIQLEWNGPNLVGKFTR
jgi:hypothetical protein